MIEYWMWVRKFIGRKMNCLWAGLIYVNKIIKHATISVLTLPHLLFAFAEFSIHAYISTEEMKIPNKRNQNQKIWFWFSVLRMIKVHSNEYVHDHHKWVHALMQQQKPIELKTTTNATTRLNWINYENLRKLLWIRVVIHIVLHHWCFRFNQQQQQQQPNLSKSKITMDGKKTSTFTSYIPEFFFFFLKKRKRESLFPPFGM